MKNCIYLLICGAILTQGCASTCPPCVPTHEITEVITPVYNCPEPPTLPPLTLPPWPVLGADATPGQTKAWYVGMVETYRVRMFMLRERVDALNTMLGAYREPIIN